MGLSQWSYSLDSHYENSSTISNTCRNILKSCVECIDNIYINAPEILTHENFYFIEIEVPGMNSIIDEFEIELKTLEQQNKKALIIMETLSAFNGVDGIPERSFNEVREKTRIEFEWSYSTYRHRLELFMPTFNQLIKKIQRKINEINERIERDIVNKVNISEEEIYAVDVVDAVDAVVDAVGNVDVDFEFVDYKEENLDNGDIWRMD
ncbi:unnamed protein product [Rhizophagus irregularis]|uniref:Uncharacterized protein n=1 Tax=Rhizophagus irregularis TaxID=588596 RepID=A0A2N1N692_9GLOM|nr:hypothetical protein RhiirC2_850776 [Rhizophagus irregularis]CAB4374678.1 unnamed protein product [Rhizophagus irregularis]CAB5375530.1 unnamed protein product [Rhizophagus irregularis]